MRTRTTRRRGVTILECAIVYPVLLILMLVLIVGAMGIFRYQQVASLARQGARYACVHGYEYSLENKLPAATQDDVRNVIVANAVNMDTSASALQVTVTWNTDNNQYHTITVTDANGFQNVQPVLNTVTVTVTYTWLPEAYLGGITMTSTSTVQMCY
jgi:Flp pilus assembly protein TadG